MNTKIFSTFLLSAMLIGASSCSNDDNDTVFMPDAQTIVKVNFFILDEPAINTFTIKVTPRTYPDLNPSGLPHDAKVYVMADPSKVESFNAQRGTKYQALPEGCYSVDSHGIIKAGKTESEPIAISIDAKGKIEQFTDYLLPVSIVGAEGVDTDDCCQTMYFVYRGSMDPSGATLLDHNKWKVLAASSEEPREGEWGNSGLKEACIDDDLSSFWSTAWDASHPEPPHWIEFDLGEEVKISGFAIQPRKEGADGTKEMTLEVSNDRISWKPAGEFKDIEPRGEYRSFLPGSVTARYVRLTITAVHGGPHVTVSEFNLF